MAAPPPVAPTQAPPRSRHPRKRQPRPGRRRTESPRRPQWRRLHQPRPRRPRRVAAAPVRDAATRRRPPARQRAPGVADSDRSQSQDGPLASGPKVLGSSVCEGLLGRARRRTESLLDPGQRRGQSQGLARALLAFSSSGFLSCSTWALPGFQFACARYSEVGGFNGPVYSRGRWVPFELVDYVITSAVSALPHSV